MSRETNIQEHAGWLSVSTEGFAQQNMGRPKEHLVKELVQNSLDSLPESSGVVTLSVTSEDGMCCIVCEDNGTGVPDMEKLRTVFWTSKHDSHHKRGRMGRGLKELLCLSVRTTVVSSRRRGTFLTNSAEEQVFRLEPHCQTEGTRVEMILPWEPEPTRKLLQKYFQTLIVPPGVHLTVDGEKIAYRTPRHRLEALLTTERFNSGIWSRPRHKTQIELHPLLPSEPEGLIYEMGIPVCPVGWSAPYHVNVLQRVPMNPNRDAVMSKYPEALHRACLPILLPEMDSETARSSWVGEAAARSSDSRLQNNVLRTAFGENLARSVPSLGKYDYDATVEEEAGVRILDTRQLSGGFKELAQTHLQTSREVAETLRRARLAEAVNKGTGSSPSLISRLGAARYRAVKKYYQWLAEGILYRLGITGKVTVKSAFFEGRYEGTWSDEMRVLTLAEELDRIWDDPLSTENFSLIIHETAHELAAHHGKSFATAMEQTAGAACRLLVDERDRITDLLG